MDAEIEADKSRMEVRAPRAILSLEERQELEQRIIEKLKTVVDASGNALAGVRLVCYNSWHRYPVVGTKGGSGYGFPTKR